jgi:hypothetical protein
MLVAILVFTRLLIAMIAMIDPRIAMIAILINSSSKNKNITI